MRKIIYGNLTVILIGAQRIDKIASEKGLFSTFFATASLKASGIEFPCAAQSQPSRQSKNLRHCPHMHSSRIQCVGKDILSV